MSVRQLPEQLIGGVRQLVEMLDDGGPPPTWSISGTITLDGDPLPGVTVTAGSASDTTDSAGEYTLAGLANGAYTVTPSLSGYTFTPANRSVTVSGANVTGRDFTAAAVIPDWPASGPRTETGVMVGLHIGALWLHARGYASLRPAGALPIQCLSVVSELRGSPTGETATAALTVDRGARIMAASQLTGLSCRLLDESGAVLLHGRCTSADLDVDADSLSLQVVSADAAPLALRRVSDLADTVPEGLDAIVPWRYGRVGGYAVQLDTTGKRWAWADHPVQGIDRVEADGVRIDGWQYRDWTDRTGRRVALIELTKPATEVWAVGRGRYTTAGLLETPTQVLTDIALLGDQTAADLLRDTEALADLRIAGSIDTDGTVRDALRTVCASIGAQWSPVARPALLALPLTGPVRHRSALVSRITREQAPTRATVRYGSVRGGPAGELQATLTDAERSGQRLATEITLPWVPDAAQALAVATRIMGAGHADTATLSGLPATARIGDGIEVDGETWTIATLTDVRSSDALVTAFGPPRYAAPTIGAQTTRAPVPATVTTIAASPASVVVRIVDASGAPMSGASVSVNGSAGLVADSAGRVAIPLTLLTQPAGSNIIRATRAGYEPVEVRL